MIATMAISDRERLKKTRTRYGTFLEYSDVRCPTRRAIAKRRTNEAISFTFSFHDILLNSVQPSPDDRTFKQRTIEL